MQDNSFPPTKTVPGNDVHKEWAEHVCWDVTKYN